MKFPEVAGSVVGVLLDFLADPNAEAALTVVFFMREIIETNTKLQRTIYEQLLSTFGQIRSSRVCSSALWIIGEYCHTAADVEAAMSTLKASLGAPPLADPLRPPPARGHAEAGAAHRDAASLTAGISR